MVDEVRKNWSGPYQVGSDFMVFNVRKDGILVRMAAINAHSWGAAVGQPTDTNPSLNIDNYQSPQIFDQVIDNCQPDG